MNIALADINWEGHHTPYVSLYTRYLIERGHDVTFVTDHRHERLDCLPDSPQVSIRTREFTRIKTRDTGLPNSLYEQFVRTSHLSKFASVISAVGADVLHLLHFDRTQLPLFLLGRFHRLPNIQIVATLHRDAFTGDYVTGSQSLTQQATSFAL